MKILQELLKLVENEMGGLTEKQFEYLRYPVSDYLVPEVGKAAEIVDILSVEDRGDFYRVHYAYDGFDNKEKRGEIDCTFRARPEKIEDFEVKNWRGQ